MSDEYTCRALFRTVSVYPSDAVVREPRGVLAGLSLPGKMFSSIPLSVSRCSIGVVRFIRALTTICLFEPADEVFLCTGEF